MPPFYKRLASKSISGKILHMKIVSENGKRRLPAFISAMLATCALLSGCAGFQNELVLDPVGPSPAHSTPTDSTGGVLVVYSAYEANADFSDPDSYNQEHSGYKVFSPDEKFLRFVQNDTGTSLHDPERVELPAGKYRIIAEANGYGHVTVPIIILNKQTTVIHLEGGGSWPNESAFNQTNAVRLPDGQIVGWRAVTENTSEW